MEDWKEGGTGIVEEGREDSVLMEDSVKVSGGFEDWVHSDVGWAEDCSASLCSSELSELLQELSLDTEKQERELPLRRTLLVLGVLRAGG